MHCSRQSSDWCGAGFNLGGQILEIDGESFRTVTPETWCRIVTEGLISNSKRRADVTVLTGQTEQTVTVTEIVTRE